MTLERNSTRAESASSRIESNRLVHREQTGWTPKEWGLFDYFVLAGGVVNLAVIIGIIGFWLAGN